MPQSLRNMGVMLEVSEQAGDKIKACLGVPSPKLRGHAGNLSLQH